MKEVIDMELRAGDKLLAQNVSFRLEEGECVLLAGANGSGKSTLMRALSGANPSFVLVPTGIPKVRGFTLEDFLATACYRESNWAGLLRPETRMRIDEALHLLSLEGLRDRDLSTLSDGEFQKGCIALGLARDAKVLLLDEPTAFLDVTNRKMVLECLAELAKKGMTVLFSSHDIQDSLAVAHRVFAFTPSGEFLVSTKENREDIIHAAFPTY